MTAQKTSILEVVLDTLKQDGGIKLLIVIFSFAIIFLFFKWVLGRFSQLFKEQDDLRKAQTEDRVQLREDIKDLGSELDKKQAIIDSQAILIREAGVRELKLKSLLVEKGVKISEIEDL